jgi:hypothetical protein
LGTEAFTDLSGIRVKASHIFVFAVVTFSLSLLPIDDLLTTKIALHRTIFTRVYLPLNPPLRKVELLATLYACPIFSCLPALLSTPSRAVDAVVFSPSPFQVSPLHLEWVSTLITFRGHHTLVVSGLELTFPTAKPIGIVRMALKFLAAVLAGAVEPASLI